MTAISRLAGAIGQFWVFLFVGLLGSGLLGEEPVLRAMVQVLYIVPLVVWAARRLRGPQMPLDVAILGALGALALAGLAGADRQGGLETLGLAIAYALTFWFLRDGIDTRMRTLFAIAGSYAFTGWVSLAAVFWMLEKIAWLRGTGSLPGFESAQVFVWETTNAFPIMVLLAVGCLVWQPRSPARSVLIGVLIAASLVAVPLSNGRAGWLGIATALIAWEGLRGWHHLRAAWTALRGTRLRLPIAVAALMVLAATGLVLAGPRLMSAAQANLGDRFAIWGQALAIFGADPLTGGGPSTFSWLRLTHVPEHAYAVPVRLAHDVPLQTLADGGLLLAVAFGALVISFLASLHGPIADQRRRVSAAVLLGIGVASLLDDFASLPAIMVAIIALAAWAVPTRPGRADTGSVLRQWSLPIGVALLGAVALPAVIGTNVARTAAAEGRVAAVAGNWSAAGHAFTVATHFYPEQAGYWLGLGLTLAEGGNEDAAVEAYTRAREHSPGDARPYGALAVLTHDAAGRVDLLQRAAARTTSDPQYSWRLGEVLSELGQPDEATHAYARALVIEPQLVTTLPLKLRDAVLAEVPVTAAQMAQRNPYLLPNLVRWDLGLATGDLPPDAAPAWRAVEASRSGDDRALGAALADLRVDGVESIELAALAAIARYRCDLEAYAPIAELLGDFRPGRLHEPTITRDHTYRDLGLGSYQPGPYALPADEPWPWSLVGEPPECPGWP